MWSGILIIFIVFLHGRLPYCITADSVVATLRTSSPLRHQVYRNPLGHYAASNYNLQLATNKRSRRFMRRKRHSPRTSPDVSVRFNFANIESTDEVYLSKLVETGVRREHVLLKKQTLGGDHHSNKLNFLVDKTIYFLSISGFKRCGTVNFTRPNGETSVIHHRSYLHKTFDDIPYDGSRGLWSLTLGGADCDIEIFGWSTLGYTGVTLMTKQFNERETAYRVIHDNPIKQKSLAIILNGFGLEMLTNGSKDRVTKVCFLDKYGNDVMESVNINTTDKINRIDSSVKVFLSDGLQTYTPVYVAVEGTNVIGEHFSRILSQPITASHVTLKFTSDHDVIIQPGVKTTVNMSMINMGLNDTFVINLFEDKYKFCFSCSNWQPIAVNSGETFIIPVTLFTRYRFKEGQAGRVIITVNGTRPGSFQSASFTAVVAKPNLPQIDTLSVKGKINSRFAETIMTSSMTNFAQFGLEARFDVMLPVDAFVTNLTITVGNKTLIGKIEKKDKSKELRNEERKRINSRDRVETGEVPYRFFNSSLFIEAGKSVTFQVTYLELLKRKKDAYKYAIMLNPDQPIKNLKMIVHLVEEEALKFVRIPDVVSADNKHAAVMQLSGITVTFSHNQRSCTFSYAPVTQQRLLLSAPVTSALFAIEYDVIIPNLFGKAIVSNGYLIQDFRSPYLTYKPKKVVFLVDKSTSIWSIKLLQMKDTFDILLHSLRDTDLFGVVYFDHNPYKWEDKLLPATLPNVENATTFVHSLQTNGGSHAREAFEAAFELMESYQGDRTQEEIKMKIKSNTRATQSKKLDDAYQNLMVILTDGHGPEKTRLVEAVQEMNYGRISIHAILFGDNPNVELLRKITTSNGGTAVRIFESIPVPLQVKNYFKRIDGVVLREVSIAYPAGCISDVTQRRFDDMSPGSHIIWAGKFNGDAEYTNAENHVISCKSFTSDTSFHRTISQLFAKLNDQDMKLDIIISPSSSSYNMTSHHKIENYFEKLWAFLYIKEKLRTISSIERKRRKDKLLQQVVGISIKYNFVTPVTSMVVALTREREEIEKVLKEEEISRQRKAFEVKMKHYGRKEKFVEKKYDVPCTAPSRHSDKGGFYGDPHFVVPINPDVNLCFNWDGKDGEIYNLLHSSSTGMTINAQLITISAPEDSGRLHRTYVGALAVLLPRIGYKLIIRPNNITFFFRQNNKFELSVTSPMTLFKQGVQLRVYDVMKKKAKISLSVDGWKFNIFLNRLAHLPYKADHLDFYVSKYNTSSTPQLNGIIGQFYNADVILLTEHDDAEQGFIDINNRFGNVVKMKRKHPGSRDEVTCWNSPNNARDLIENTHESHRVDDLLYAPH